MTTLGSVTLSDELILSGLETAPDVVVNQRRTVTGESAVQVAPIAGGRALTLSGENHFTLAEIQAVKALAAAGSAVALVHDRGTFSVLITGTPVVPTGDHANPGSDAWYSGDITMIEV